MGPPLARQMAYMKDKKIPYFHKNTLLKNRPKRMNAYM
jgi:hypothetical protein